MLSEGGNIFKDAAGVPVTQRINQTDIMPTVKWLETVTGLDFTTEKNPLDRMPARWLGSTGRKASSGDLDLQVDAGEISKDRLTTKLQNWVTQQGLNPAEYVKKSGVSVHFKTPIRGNPELGFVQSDFMFTEKPRWNQFVLYADPNSEYKGATRNVLINSMAKSMGYKLNQNAGVADRATSQLITDDPNQAAKLLLNPNATAADLSSVETIMAALENDPKREAKLADFRDHMQRMGTPFTENVETEVSWIARLRDRIVNQGMQMIMEAARIEHPEDLVFSAGSRGLKQALDSIVAAAQEPQQATIKWDGKPAIVFGRKPTGEFVLTDKSGFSAKGYNGLATSTQHIAQIMQARGGDRADLISMYTSIFPVLRRAVPQNFRGYLVGDLLFVGQPPLVKGAYEFQPNTVKYRVPAGSDLGRQLANASVGVAIHTATAAPDATPQPISSASGLTEVPGLLVLDPVLNINQPVSLDSAGVKRTQQLIQQYGPMIDALFNPQQLRDQKITNFPALIKQYINSRVREGNYNNLMKRFVEWLPSRESQAKTQRILEWIQQNPRALPAVFQSFVEISNLKNGLVRQLDSQSNDIQASVDGEPGHEGYVGHGVKFVDRMRFSAANFARNNPELS